MKEYRIVGKKADPEDNRKNLYILEQIKTGTRVIVPSSEIRMHSQEIENVKVYKDGKIEITEKQ